MAGPSPHVTLIEDGGWGRAPRPETPGRALASATVTLTLAILGSSVLPVPYAVSRLGVLPGLGIMLAVGLGNSLAGTLLLRAAAALDQHTYEGLAQSVGGPSWRLTTEVCLVLLLWGNLTGDFCLLADTGSIAAAALYPGGAPAWLTAGGGRLIMAALALLVVFPLSCLRRMRELELVGTAGFAFVALLAAIFIGSAASAGFPALRSGELPLLRPAVLGSLPEAIGVLSFAFYLAPMLLPLLREMPAGQLGVDLTCRAQQIVTAGIAFAVYAVAGFFAAARYGLATQGDVLVNAWLPGRWDGALDAAVVVYLSVCMAPIAVTLRCQLENLVSEEGRDLPRGSQVALTAAALASSLALALAFPTRAEKMFAVTGATAACAVCYVLPVAIHLRLYLRGTAWWPGGGKGRRRRRGRHSRHGSFSFDATGTLGGSIEEQRGLLGSDHGAGAAALRPPQLQRPSAAAAAAFAAQLQGRGATQEAQQWWRRGVEWSEEDEAWPAGGMGGHRWTDLSLKGWLRGQSYDSMAHGTADSLPATNPASPTAASLRYGRGAERGSMDSLSAAGWEDEEAAAGGSGAGGTPPFAAAAVSPAALAAAALPLPAVPEAASVAGGSIAREVPPDGSANIYPCFLADAALGWRGAGPLLRHLVLPLLLLLLGVASSLSALCLAVAALV